MFKNPYDSFMKKHLEHYGYFTGRNMAIARFGFEPKRGYKNIDSDESECDSDDSENSSNKAKSKFLKEFIFIKNFLFYLILR